MALTLTLRVKVDRRVHRLLRLNGLNFDLRRLGLNFGLRQYVVRLLAVDDALLTVIAEDNFGRGDLDSQLSGGLGDS